MTHDTDHDRRNAAHVKTLNAALAATRGIHDPARARREDHRQLIVAAIADLSQTPPLVWRATALVTAAGELVDRLSEIHEILDQSDPDDDGGVEWLHSCIRNAIDTVELARVSLLAQPALRLMVEGLVDEQERSDAQRLDGDADYRAPQPFDLGLWLDEAEATLWAALGEKA
jgi:hypothetical protein